MDASNAGPPPTDWQQCLGQVDDGREAHRVEWITTYLKTTMGSGGTTDGRTSAPRDIEIAAKSCNRLNQVKLIGVGRQRHLDQSDIPSCESERPEIAKRLIWRLSKGIGDRSDGAL